MSKSTKEYFDCLEDEILIEMAQNYPEELIQLCNLVSLDMQLDVEGGGPNPLFLPS